MGRAGGSEDVHVGPEKIAFLILERFIEMIRPEPPSLFTFKQITVTFEEIKAQVITRSGLDADENDPDQEIFKACVIATQQFPHLFQFALCKHKSSSKPEIGLQYTALRLP
ncbi:MAG: hypothetical protein A3C07_04410 [Candidatus Sungbacteria bacterium RIFCSPHIGHO2_02_FULL_47_11]|uniref:Uncharacterized protein n=1 Tax=Candidatus Sungbacteria bacterium RIFCSPHIGHO2_02_FULL_47_11 TaxID=1802270 RepID=A0A1G2KGB5_9BACT|nr:MAG: hypothetical protein A3C07_04410 [Candidatus Sungbacteria bacterium RIFCSPHIGHO2_02_FULL_47_11]